MKLQQFAKIKPTAPNNVENINDINKNITDNTTISILYLNIKTLKYNINILIVHKYI